MTNTPSSVFDNIEKDPYLNELYESILFNYAIDSLEIKTEKKHINITDALQFADALSRSTHTKNADKHKGLAQEMISLLSYLEPNNANVQYVLGAVLTNVGNYQGMMIAPTIYDGGSLFDSAYDHFSRDFVAVPAEPDKHFFRSQKIAYDNLTASAFSYSGPTSLGKSFIMRMFIKQQIIDGIKQNYAIIVPTKALINEVSHKLIYEELNTLLK